MGINVNRLYQKKRKILESEVSEKAMKKLRIDELIGEITIAEDVLKTIKNNKTVQHIISLYNKAIEYYSAFNNEKHFEYLQKL